jgi:hypothetical protein
MVDALAKIEDSSVKAPKVDTIISEPIGRWMQDVHVVGYIDIPWHPLFFSDW